MPNTEVVVPLETALVILSLVEDERTRKRLTRFINGKGEKHLLDGDIDALNDAIVAWGGLQRPVRAFG